VCVKLYCNIIQFVLTCTLQFWERKITYRDIIVCVLNCTVT